jgi:uncharacterized protein YhjY with autotransporter beta-barrel domain
VTTTQTLDVNGETGLIESGGFLDLTAGTSKAIIIDSDLTTSVSITNNGTITAQRDAIDDGGTNTGVIVTIINNGTISTTADSADSDAINFTGTTASTLILTNNGTIETFATSIGAEAIVMGGDNNIVINNGTIVTQGTTADAITTSCQNCTITNNGTIITKGTNAHGIFYLNPAGAQESLTITNTGSIITKGTTSNGILLNNEADVIVNNSGLIHAFDSTEEAIRGGGGADTLNLLSGSQIIGIIDLNGGTDIVNISGANNSSTLTLTDVETINLINGNGLIVGTVATVVDPTGQSISSAVLSNTTLAIHNNVNQRLAHHKALKPIQVATSELTSGMVFQERAPQIWGSALGAQHSRGLEGIALGYDHDYVGFTGGYEVSFYKARMGLLGGFVKTNIKTTGDAFGRLRSIDTDTDSFFVGAYSQYFLGNINLTTTLMAGYEDHDNDRAVVDNLNGFETAQADFSSFFISPSLTLSSAYVLDEYFELRPSATLAYSGGWYEDYAESGTTRSDLVIDDRDAHALTGQLQLAAAYSPYEDNELELRAGAKARYTDNDNIDVSLAGTNFQIPNASDNDVYGGYIGMNLRIAIKEKINLIADVEQGFASGNENHAAVMVRLEGVF